jgi:hypothetical protein
LPEEAFSSKGKYMKTIVGLWIDHRKAVIVAVSDKKEETKVIESNGNRGRSSHFHILIVKLV